MSIEATFVELLDQVNQLGQCCRETCLAIDDHPSSHYLVDQLSDAAQDILGWNEEAIKHVTEGRRSVQERNDVALTRAELSAFQKIYLQISDHLANELSSHQRHAQLRRLSKRNSRWLGWANVVEASLLQVEAIHARIQHALAACWQEVAERSNPHLVAIHNSNVGAHAEVSTALSDTNN